MNILEEIKFIPTTRYQGSKRKILPWLYDCIKDIEFDTVLDAFGGSGMVSYLFKRMGKTVTYNDIFRFNQIIGQSIIENNNVLLTEEDILFILSYQKVETTFISDTFKGIYFLDDENLWLDMIIQNIERLSERYSSNISRYKKAVAYNALFQSCMVKRPYNLFHRKNLEMRTRDVKRNFGNKTTWDRPFPEHFQSFVHEINRSIYNSNKNCKAINKDVFAVRAINYDLVYLDPPYIKCKGESNESSDYLKCYHFLEGIANYSYWKTLIDDTSFNKRIFQSYTPNYFTPKDPNHVFECLIKKFRNSIIILSYRYGGIPTIEDLCQIMLKYKSYLTVYDKHYKYALNKQNGDSVLNREYLLIGY